MPYSNISIAVPAADKTSILASIASARALLSFMVNLTPTERATLSKMGDDTFSYVDKAYAYALANPTLVPSWLNTAEWTKDQNLWKDLRDILIQVATLAEGLTDTKMAAGVESKNSADIFYNTVKVAAEQNVVGAQTIYEDLFTFYDKAAQEIATP